MADRPQSPFAALGSLDKQLLRPTRAKQEAPPPAAPKEEVRQEDESVQADTQARTHVRTRARTSAPTHASLDGLFRRLHEKQHLASSTFRFRADELEELEAVFAEVKKSSRTISKNDIVRLGLTWLLEDYRRNKDESVLAQVLTRT